jgi:hypothetical protein
MIGKMSQLLVSLSVFIEIQSEVIHQEKAMSIPHGTESNDISNCNNYNNESKMTHLSCILGVVFLLCVCRLGLLSGFPTEA